MKIKLELLTPEKKILKEEVDEIIVPTVNGEIGILPNHAALVTQIMPGELLVKNNGKTTGYAITGGYMEVSNNSVNILGDYAIRAEDIEVAKAEEAKKRAEKKMEEKVSQQDFATIEAELRRSLLELKVARKNRPQRPN